MYWNFFSAFRKVYKRWWELSWLDDYGWLTLRRRQRLMPWPGSIKKNLTVSTDIYTTVFWVQKGVLFVNLIAHGQEVNSVLYRETLDRLRETVCQNRVGRLSKGAIWSKECLPRPWYDWNVLLHPLHSFYLILLDHHMFGYLKWHLSGKRRFHTNIVVFTRIQGWLHSLDAMFFEKGCYTLVHQSASISMAAT